MFLCSPGNPTCVKLSVDDILKVLQSEAYNGVVVVDEAYIDFAGPGASMATLTSQYANLVVIQTMSKAWGLAGIRCGFAISNAATIEVMNKVKAPYSVNKLTSAVANEALAHKAKFDEKLCLILTER